MKISKDALNAIRIGGLCSLSYLAVYIARNVLGAVSPKMIESGAFETGQIGVLSSVFFTTYALGQLINGFIGDKIKAKYMISLGLSLAAVAFVLFASVKSVPLFSYVTYGMTGFFLSMIYGPMTKVVAENTNPIHATRCSLGYTFSSLFGTPLAGVLAALFLWRTTFYVSSSVMILMGVICFICFTVYEKKKIVQYGIFKKPKKSGGNAKILIKRDIIRFSFIAVLTGIIRTSVVFWMPTYISQHLKFPADKAALVFTVATSVISITPFITIFVYERLKRNMYLTIRLGFILSAISFLGVFLCKNPTLNIICFVTAVMCCNSADSMMWSRYCPSLLDTGMVSTATGYLDFLSYMAAATASSIFANAVSSVGWSNLILIWMGLMALGILVLIPNNFIKKNDA